MKKKIALAVLLAAGMLTIAIPQGRSQTRNARNIDGGVGLDSDVMIPETSLESPEDIGVRAHTNHMLKLGHPEGGLGPGGGMSPAQIRSFYGMGSTGGSFAIAIVDAFDYPTALNDFNVFATQFGLPLETSTNVTASTNQVFQIVYENGTKPAGNCGWNQEEALDIEWAHAMAPSAKIYLVEAASTSFTDLFHAIDVASGLASVKEVSLSWGGSEFSGETADDSHFPQTNGIVYFAASGDTGGQVIYPSASPNVVACGGTTVNTNSAGAFTSEQTWSGSGGGSSTREARPSYQASISSLVGTHRGIPDMASDANPSTGVSVYDSTPCQGLSGWLVFGGTSVATPTLAGEVNLAGHFEVGGNSELTVVYSKLGTSAFRDITSGSRAGRNSARVGWDFVTGVGTPQGTSGI